MPYGIIKIDTVIFTNDGVDKSVSISGLVQNPTFSGNVTVTGTISGVTVTGTTASFTSGNFTNISGGTHTITSGVFAAGSATNPSISFTSDPNTGIYSPGADQVAISTNGTGRLFVDSSGNVGFGTTAPVSTLNIRKDSLGTGGVAESAITLTYSSTNYGQHFIDANGSYNIYANNNGVAGGNLQFRADASLIFNTASNERARIDSSGRLLVGTSSGSYKFQIGAIGSGGFAFDDTTTAISGTFGTGGNLTLRAQVSSSTGGGQVYLGGSTRGDSDINSVVISTDNTERMRIGANGYIHASNTGSYYSTGTSHELSGNSATESSLLVVSFNTSKSHGNTSACLVVADYDSDYTNSNLFGGWNVTNNSWRIFIRGNGNVENVNNSYGALSDAKLKENIVNACSQWNDIKALQVRKYNFKEGQTHTQIGLIAQEVELVSPGLVSESPDRDKDGNDLGTVTKSVNYSVLYMKAVKALQEAMERIETLEAKVAALESA